MELIFNILQEDENDKPSSDIIFIWTKFFFTFFYFLFLFISLIKTVLNFFFILSIFLIIHISNEQI